MKAIFRFFLQFFLVFLILDNIICAQSVYRVESPWIVTSNPINLCTGDSITCNSGVTGFETFNQINQIELASDGLRVYTDIKTGDSDI